MKAAALPLFTLCFALLFSCVSAPPKQTGQKEKAGSTQSGALNAVEVLALAKASCFEVVLEKAATDSLVYDKNLNWDLVDFNIRNDKYISIGTAFAIDSEHLVTAAHVLSLFPNSRVYPKRYIREKKRVNGKTVESVYEIDEIQGFSSNRDFAVFSVKGRKFDSFLEKSLDYEFGSKILTAGNAFGEGIVVREGLLLDELPENENGEWSYLKSSVATNPGNSGGPLMNERGQVIGIVLSRKDDFCYALPLSEMSLGKASFHTRITLGFTVFNKRRQSLFEKSYPCPIPYMDLVGLFVGDDAAFYQENMNALLGENAADIFPNGNNSEKALYEMENAYFPQFFLQDNASNLWFSTSHSPSAIDIGGNGSIRAAEIYKDAEVFALRLDKPDGMSVKEIWESPRLTMDLLLKGLSIKRKMSQSDEGSRITSYGEPFLNETRIDRFGRSWRLAAWTLEYSDQIVLTASLPTPKGLAILYVAKESSQLGAWLYDMAKLLDFTNISFFGKISEWKDFLASSQLLNGSLSALTLTSPAKGGLEVKTADIQIVFSNSLFTINDDSELYLAFDVYTKKGKPVWDLRKIVLDPGNAGNSYYLCHRWTSPSPNLSQAQKDNYRSALIERGHPYSGKAYTENGHMNIGTIHPVYLKDAKVAIPNDHAYTVFVSKEGSASDGEMEAFLAEFTASIEILDK